MSSKQRALRGILCLIILVGLAACTRSKPPRERPPFTGIPTLSAPSPTAVETPKPTLQAAAQPAPTQSPTIEGRALTPTLTLAAAQALPSPQPTATLAPTLLLLPTPTLAAPTPTSTEPTTHTVSHVVGPGETLYQIARLYNTTVEAILAWNPSILDPNHLVRGTTLLVPIGPGGRARTHTVGYGENLSSIAARYGVTVEALMQANGLTNRHLIYAGQQLIIPSQGE